MSQKKLGHFYFYRNFVKCWSILIFFCIITRNHLWIRYKQYFPPHLNFVASLPCKTNTSMNRNVTIVLFYSAIKYLNKSYTQLHRSDKWLTKSTPSVSSKAMFEVPSYRTHTSSKSSTPLLNSISTVDSSPAATFSHCSLLIYRNF